MKLVGRKQQPNKVELTISNQTVVRVMIIVVLTLIGLAALNKVSHALILIFMAFFLSVALNAPVHWIAEHLPGKRRGNRTLATSLSFLLVIGALFTFIALIVPPAIRQTTQFIQDIPKLIEEASQQDNALGRFISDTNLEEASQDIGKEVASFATNSSGSAVATVSTVGSSLISLFAVLAMTFMMLIEGPRWLRLGMRLLPEHRREYGAKVTADMYKVVRGFVNGQATLAFIAALVLLPVMLALQVPYAGALAVIVFLCGLIPMFGHIIGATIVTIIALFESPISALLVLSFYILYQQIENYVVQPRVQANATNISPLLVFIAVLVGVNLNGVIGGIVAIPVAGCLRIIVLDYLYSRGKLEPATADTK